MFTEQELMNAYRAMYMSRCYENKVNQLFQEKRIEEKPLSGIGQEATSVGPVILLEEGDFVAPTLRSKGAFFAKGITPLEAFLQLMRRKGSLSGGVWTSHHLGNMKKGVILSSAIVASSMSVATGVALAAKLRGQRHVVVSFVGDGSTSRGDFHTAVNFAAVQNLPVIFVVENNLYALSTHISEQMKEQDIAKRASGYGIPGVIVDGQDCIQVMEKAKEAIKRARDGEGPTLIECKTYRFRGHTESHDPDDGRPQEELERYRARCPIQIMERYLEEQTDISSECIGQVREAVEEEISQALAEAEKAPEAIVEDFEKLVYAD